MTTQFDPHFQGQVKTLSICFLILAGLFAGLVVFEQNAQATDDLIFIPDSGVRMQNASNPGIYQDKNGTFHLYYRNMVATSTDGLNFSNGMLVNDTNDFRAIKLADGTYRRYYWDQQGGTPSTVYGLKSKSSKDGVHFTDDQGYRYQLDASDKGTAGIHEFFVDKSGGIVLLYIGDLLGTNNIRRAYSEDNGWTFNFERGNILGDANDGKPGSFIDHKVVILNDGRRRLFTVRQGNIYSFISNDDGKTFTQEPGTRLAPTDFKELDVIGFSDPVFIKLADKKWRVYTTAFLKGYVPEPGGSQKEIIVSAITAEENTILKEGDLISAADYGDPDIFIINSLGYKRLFLNPAIFNFYGHLGGFHKVKKVTPEVRDSYITSGLFRNCEIDDRKVYGVEIKEEDKGSLHWINTSGNDAVRDDPEFFKKVFCINNREYGWYPKGAMFNSVAEVPNYSRKTQTPIVQKSPTPTLLPQDSIKQKPLRPIVLSQAPYIEDHPEIEHCPKNISGIFTHRIVDTATLDHIVPLGHINPENRHVKPISHIYHSFKKEAGRVPVYAPANSLLVSLGTLKTPEAVLYNIEFIPCREIQVSMMDISEISDDLANLLQAKGGECGTTCWAEINKKFKAGELIGKTTILDLAVYDQRVTTPFISPERYTYTMLHGICALDLFPDDLKNSFYDKMSVGEWQRIAEPRCGSVAQDVPGTIQGEWFIGPASEQRWDYDVKVLSIIHGNYEPLPGIITTVDTIIPSPGLVAFIPKHSGFINREPSEIKDPSIYCFQHEKGALVPSDQIYPGTKLTGRILIQLVDAKTLKAEHQEKSCSESLNFNSPTSYER